MVLYIYYYFRLTIDAALAGGENICVFLYNKSLADFRLQIYEFYFKLTSFIKKFFHNWVLKNVKCRRNGVIAIAGSC